jgi:nitroimidazol reductase NimA-like FMN-containing flavoprotein (pyridoxamine 5'-phosphate oxidase superfamily)
MMAKQGEPPIGRAGLNTASANVLVLPEDECWSLLLNHKVGRLAIVVEGRPRIFPINYAAADQALVFRTEPGAKLKHGPGTAACFEIDDYDQRDSTAWSVMVVGALEDITDAGDDRSRSLRRLPVEPAAPGTRLHWLVLNVEEVSGRRFRGGWIVPGHYLG